MIHKKLIFTFTMILLFIGFAFLKSQTITYPNHCDGSISCYPGG